MMNRGPNLTSPKERNHAQPSRVVDTDSIGSFEHAKRGYKVDMVVVQIGFVMEHRLLSFGEEEGR